MYVCYRFVEVGGLGFSAQVTTTSDSKDSRINRTIPRYRYPHRHQTQFYSASEQSFPTATQPRRQSYQSLKRLTKREIIVSAF
jgi:hypothetical protein